MCIKQIHRYDCLCIKLCYHVYCQKCQQLDRTYLIHLLNECEDCNGGFVVVQDNTTYFQEACINTVDRLPPAYVGEATARLTDNTAWLEARKLEAELKAKDEARAAAVALASAKEGEPCARYSLIDEIKVWHDL